MRKSIVSLAFVALITASTSYAAGDAAKGQTLSASKCAMCHGPAGQGVGKNPKLAGLDAAHIETQLKAYQSGARQHMMMTGIAKKLSEQDVADLAAFFSTQAAP